MSVARRLLRALYTIEAARIGPHPAKAGALCWRPGPTGIEILLVTSRRSGKWGIPKGWSLRGRALSRTAEREAWEEAGVRGSAHRSLLGIVPAPKRHGMVGMIDWRLAVYALQVTEIAREWPEDGQRAREWFARDEAAERVRPRALASIIAAFDP